MAAGRWIAAHGTVPAVDVFSYTFAGAPWFNQEWLSQVAFYELYRVAGGTALAVLKIRRRGDDLCARRLDRGAP